MSRSRGRKPVSLALSGRPRAKPRSVGPPTPRRSCRPAGSGVRQVRGPVFVAPEAEVCQDATNDAGIFNRGDQAHPATAVRTREHVHREDPLE